MLAQICQFFAVDSSNFPLNEHIIIGDRSCQSGFLIHFFLNLCQKQNRPVLFVGLSQSFSHYNTVGQKLGNKLLSARNENKSLIFVDGLHLLSEGIGTRSVEKIEQNPFLDLLRGNSAPLLELIRVSFETLAQTEIAQFNAPVVIIDDLSILHSAGVASEELLVLVNRIREISTSGTTKGSLISLFHLDKASKDKNAEVIWALLTHMSTLKIEVSDLQSGYCKDVHGQIHAEWRDTHDKPRNCVTKHTQFKLSDKSIDLFAPGMSAAVL